MSKIDANSFDERDRRTFRTGRTGVSTDTFNRSAARFSKSGDGVGGEDHGEDVFRSVRQQAHSRVIDSGSLMFNQAQTYQEQWKIQGHISDLPAQFRVDEQGFIEPVK